MLGIALFQACLWIVFQRAFWQFVQGILIDGASINHGLQAYWLDVAIQQ